MEDTTKENEVAPAEEESDNSEKVKKLESDSQKNIEVEQGELANTAEVIVINSPPPSSATNSPPPQGTTPPQGKDHTVW